MRLFHVSEDPNITVFHPRLPTRSDLDPSVGLVWAIDEAHLPNFLTPRDCPRVAYSVCEETTKEDRERFFSSQGTSHALIIENKWFSAMQNTTLYLYEMDPGGFRLQDGVAGYYVSVQTQYPLQKHIKSDLFGELFCRNVEVRFADNLWSIAEAVKVSSLHWSLCRMANAQPRIDK